MATRKRTTASDELHRLVTELHAHSVESRVLFKAIAERLDKVEAQVADQGKTLSWYEFSIKAAKALGVFALLLLTLKLGDIPNTIRTLVTK